MVAMHVNDAAAVEEEMPEFRRVTDDFYVAAQISEADVSSAAAAGFKTIVNNRPDDEEEGQLRAEDARRAAGLAGIDYNMIPFSGPPSAAAIAETEKLLKNAAKPILAHCRSGTRSTTVWAMASVKSGAMTPEAAVEAAAAAGYDLKGLLPTLKGLAPA
jgi:uncharacterized protein (TIGR01244 family)